ncbi:unnamed protein product [Aureobasidium uvarum]|uniref:Uncharacterized protein n=1 Tax=Aureobasidium uvarum TaxID=2773716 RepID=A0A9N8K8G1_9PEZI|nr:unnamed protein product [Aureobasidium uvarum]
MFAAYHMTQAPSAQVDQTISLANLEKDPRIRPPCECGNCEQQFTRMERQLRTSFWYESVVTPNAASALLAEFVDRINTDRAYLSDLCDKFGNTISSRWRKKSHHKREALLLQADPTIEKEPWFRLRTGGNKAPIEEVRRHKRQSWLLPYMSTTIMKTNLLILLGLLHHRVHLSPEEWAPFDSVSLKHGWTTGVFDLQYCGNVCMIVYGNGQIDHGHTGGHCVVMHGVDYGKLVPWDKKAAERWDIVGYPRARLIIEAQALMFSRLRSIVDLILEGVNRDIMGASDKWQEMVRTGFKQTKTIELWSDYINQPFSSPPKLDIDYYCSVANARMQAAQDHLWLLQTDPSYVRRFIKVMAVGEVYRLDYKHRLVTADICHAVFDCQRWMQLNEAWNSVRSHNRRFHDSIHPGQPLPRLFELSLTIMECALLDTMDKGASHLSVYITQRPGFRQYYKFHKASEGSVIVESTMACSEAEQYYNDPLDFTLMQLQGDPDAELRFDHAELFAKLEAHLTDASKEERARLDETLYAKLSDFAAQHEMLSAVRSHRPAYFRRGPEDLEKMLQENPTSFTRGLIPQSSSDPEALEFSPRYMQLFDQSAPAVGRKNQAWLDCRTVEREALANFWEQARKSLRLVLGLTRMKQEEIDDAMSLVSASTSREYAEMVEAERLEVLDAIAADALSKKTTSTATPQEAFRDTGPDVSTLVLEEKAPKPKTRPSQSVDVSTSRPASLEIDINEDMESHSPIQISATSRALEIIRKIFPSSAEETLAKDTDWDVFVHAMNDLSFSARNVGGSAVAFENPSRKKIIFHRPHPSPKIDSVMLQSMGKRMRKHFDWSRETFVGV